YKGGSHEGGLRLVAAPWQRGIHMIRRAAGQIAGCVLAVAILHGQGAPAAPAPQPPGGRGGGRGGPALVSPEVKADNTVTLRFRAPNAQQVTLIGELDGKTYPMTKDDGGIWSVRMGPL